MCTHCPSPARAPLRKCWMRPCHSSNWLSHLIWEYETVRHDTRGHGGDANSSRPGSDKLDCPS